MYSHTCSRGQRRGNSSKAGIKALLSFIPPVNNTNTTKLDLSTAQTRSSDISSERKRGDVCKEEKIRARAKGLGEGRTHIAAERYFLPSEKKAHHMKNKPRNPTLLPAHKKDTIARSQS
jgi:hypothetical protein